MKPFEPQSVLINGDQKMQQNNEQFENDIALPLALSEDLKTVFTSGIPDHRASDLALLRDARDHFDKIKHRKKRQRVQYIGKIWAAMLLMAIGIYGFMTLSSDQAGMPVQYAMFDIDRNGDIDILDCMTLAAKNDPAAPFIEKYDFNHDHLFDQKDIDMIAMSAVTVNTRGVMQ